MTDCGRRSRGESGGESREERVGSQESGTSVVEICFDCSVFAEADENIKIGFNRTATGIIGYPSFCIQQNRLYRVCHFNLCGILCNDIAQRTVFQYNGNQEINGFFIITGE